MTSTRHSFAQFGCAPFADNARTLAYHEWACREGLYPDECEVELWDCSCPLDAPDVPFTTPDDPANPAPWYDPNDPASMEFLGAMILGIAGMTDSTAKRDPSDAFGDGTILNRLRLAGRSFTFEILLLSTSCRGADYGVEWLRRVLETDLCGCGPNPCEACYGKELTVRRSCDDAGEECDSGLRSWSSVGVVDGIKVTTDGEDACCCVVQRATFVMQSEQPYSFGCTTEACAINSATTPYFEKCFDWGSECDDCCDEDRYGNRRKCDRCLTDPLCEDITVDDPRPTSIDAFVDCYCEPLQRRIQSCCVQEIGAAGFDTALTIEVFSGVDGSGDADALYFAKYGLRNLRISIFDNPDSLPCITDEESYDAFCATRPKPRFELQMPYIPANSTLTIDGRSQRVFLECDGKCRPFPYALDNTKGRLFPLVTNCEPMIVTFEWDTDNSQLRTGPGRVPSMIDIQTHRRWRS